MGSGSVRLPARSLLVLTVAVLALALSACAKARNVDEQAPLADVEDVEPGGPIPDGVEDDVVDEDPVDVDEVEDDTAAVAEDPAPFVGATVTVTGTVNEVVDQNAFEIRVDDAGDVGFLVLVPGDDVNISDVVEVTGIVREADFEELAAELDFEVDEDLYSPADSQYVIVADGVQVIDPAGR